MTRSEQHNSAVQRLEAVLAEQDRLSQRYDAAIGTSTELGDYVRLRAAGGQVAAREAWLHWIDDESYRGLNAGPFELLAESVVAWRDKSARKETPHGNRHSSRSLAFRAEQKPESLRSRVDGWTVDPGG